MSVRIIHGDAREVLATLPDASVQLCMTSPPYFALRSYLPAGHPDKSKEIGLEPSPAEFVAAIVGVFRDVRRVLRDDGVLILNLGDSMAGSWGARAAQRKASGTGTVPPGSGLKAKDLLGIPFAVAFALRDDGWYWRSCLPWVKRSVLPESVEDRPGNAVEYVLMFSKRPACYWDAEAVRRKGAIAAGTRAAKGSAERAKHANGMPPEYAVYSGTRNFRNTDLFFDSLEPPFGLICDGDGDPLAIDVNPQPFNDAHFATYPPALVRPFVMAGTSERGCCAACGASWVRVVERTGADMTARYARGGPTRHGKSGAAASSASDVGSYSGVSQTTGWLPSCRCKAPTKRCTILDPFSGAGTTALVADRLGRNAIGIELNADYVTMSRNRITGDAPLLTDVA